MTELLTAAEMRAIEGAAISSGQVTGLELMERAGAGVVASLLAHWPELNAAGQRAVVLCGPGNNGGDGFVVARVLAQAGWSVEVLFYGQADALPPDARKNYDRWREIGAVTTLTPATLDHSLATTHPPSVLIDAVFGTGLGRGIDLPLDAITGLPRIVAADIPSGLCSDSGRILGAPAQVIKADLTVTFHRAKLGHMLADGPQTSGRVRVVDIGL